MPLLHFPVSSSLHPPRLCSSSKPKPKPKPGPVQPNPPARDRVIDFGKHRGNMLGSLPSTYLRWVSRTLRARDSEEWARLADEVLADPVYRDRLEWESAQRILTGDGIASASRSETPASDLLEISDRFGWDPADRAGWARLDFQLLGTSHGGRIPRVQNPSSGNEGETPSFPNDSAGLGVVDSKISKDGDKKMGNVGKRMNFSRGNEVGSLGSSTASGDGLSGGKMGFLREGYRFIVEEEEEEGEEEVERSRRMERREKRRMKREQQLEVFRREVGVEEERDKRSDGGFIGKERLGNGEVVNPFPGRGALLDKINKRR